MPQKSLAPEKVERARELRQQGKTINQISKEVGISEGSASNATRDIVKPVSESQKGAPQSRREGNNTLEVVGGPYSDEAKELANRVKKARLQGELDEIEDRRLQRLEISDLRIRERKLLVQLDEARVGVNKGDGAVTADITQLRGELAELREARHQAELRAIEDRHSAEVKRLEQQIASIGRSGLGRYDLLSQGFDKLESLVVLAGSKVDSFMASNRSDGQFMMALQLGLSPDEFEILKAGLQTPITRAQFDIIKGSSGVRPEPGEYEALVALTERRNQQYRELAARVGPRLRQGGPPVVRGGKPGNAPAPSEPEPVILKAESKLAKCTRCGCEFDIDLAEVRQKAGPGKRLFVHCANPKCQFMLDISELLSLKVAPKGPAPECYAGAESGCANKERYPYCQDCVYRDFSSQVFE